MFSLHSVIRIGGLLLLALFLLLPPVGTGGKPSSATTAITLLGLMGGYAPDHCSPVLKASVGSDGFIPWAREPAGATAEAPNCFKFCVMISSNRVVGRVSGEETRQSKTGAAHVCEIQRGAARTQVANVRAWDAKMAEYPGCGVLLSGDRLLAQAGIPNPKN